MISVSIQEIATGFLVAINTGFSQTLAAFATRDEAVAYAVHNIETVEKN